MDEQLFMIEILVKKIIFEKSVKVPKKEDLYVICSFEGVLDEVEIKTTTFSEEIGDAVTLENFNAGKSVLFPSSSKKLIKDFKTNKLQMSLLQNITMIATVEIPWKDDFAELVDLSDTIGVVKPFSYEDTYSLKDDSKKKIAEVTLFVRLSCFGKNIQTQFQVKGAKGNKQLLYKNPNASTTFTCRRYDKGTSYDMIPVTPLYPPEASAVEIRGQMSWEAIFDSGLTPKLSMAPLEFQFGLPLGKVENLENMSAIDLLNMYFQKGERKFLDLGTMKGQLSGLSFFGGFGPAAAPGPDLLEDQSDERSVTCSLVQGEDGTAGLACKLIRKVAKGVASTGSPRGEEKIQTIQDLDKVELSPKVEDDTQKDDELTADYINRILCKNKDCPAAKKFAQYGIGPLATGKGLGVADRDLEPPAVYGLSHTYGTLDQYGPYGLFRRPKRLDEPYVPPKNALDTTLPSPNKNNKVSCGKEFCNRKPESPITQKKRNGSCYSPLRLTGGGQGHSEITGQLYAPLRLTGGGPLGLDDLTGPKSPFLECKGVMEQFDKILANYRSALGPCGQVTCPYAPNVAKEICKKVCPQPQLNENIDLMSCIDLDCPLQSPLYRSINKKAKDMKENDPLMSCGEVECPYTDAIEQSVNKRFQGNRIKAACGFPTCAYTKYKIGLADDDAALELQFLPPAISGRCGRPKCPYPVKPDLPPIHWDCPDPLPKGPCKNPDCPFLPPDLKALKLLKNKGPCGSPDCPYALPQPCDIPTCPFKPKPCPFEAQQEKEVQSTMDKKYCGKPECPFADVDQISTQSCDNIDCPFSKMKYGSAACANPDCPFANPKPGRKKGSKICDNPNCPVAAMKEVVDSCPNPECPFQNQKDGVKKTSNAECPYNKLKIRGEFLSCANPDCPFTNPKPDQKKSKICDNPKCPVAAMKEKVDTCPNAECPFQNKQDIIEKTSSTDVCGNPSCPFAKKPDVTKENADSTTVCTNPNCPYASNNGKGDINICESPNCPFKGLELDEVCSLEDCPFSPAKKLKNRVCDNPECPFTSKRECDNPDCPYKNILKDDICNDPYCPYIQPLPSCGIPNCPFEAVSKSLCPSPNCPYKSKPPYLQSSGKKASGDASSRKTDAEVIDVAEKKSTIEKNAITAGANASAGVSEVKIGQSKGALKKRKKRGKYVYSMGDKYPGLKVGHKECVMPCFKVPAKMGWLWNIHTPCMSLKPRRGWRPGAVGKTIAARIKQHRNAKGLGQLKVPNFKKYGGVTEGTDSDATVCPKPTLQIKKKEGCYWITMNPLKDPATLADNENPYMDCTPMQFKIVKNKGKVKIKDEEDDDYKTCFCDEEGSTSSDSELDIEFTPPAGIIHPERYKKKKNVIHCDTQYDPKDCEEPKSKKDKKEGKGKKDKKDKKGKKEKKDKKGKKKK